MDLLIDNIEELKRLYCMHGHIPTEIDVTASTTIEALDNQDGAGSRALGMTYSQFMHGLKLAGVEVDRKNLADLPVNDPAAFEKMVEILIAT
ncbi:MAG: hypothetical protein CM1200mP15_18290 [Dehalococcoidia bacterium]|nr:MAG: hypothetical protein CM1200mP15_18290 [Dehalococcoidia bacterium]